MYTDTVNINIEAENLTALSSVYQSDYSSIENSTLQCCIVHDGASDARADRCSISSTYHHRKRYQCKYNLVNNHVQCNHVSIYNVVIAVKPMLISTYVCHYKCKRMKYLHL